MNPNRLTNELRRLPGNIRSPQFPGGTLVSAVLDRQLMTWSDRGGASRIFGEIWSEYTWSFISNGTPLLYDEIVGNGNWQVVRLDDNPRLAIQAGKNKLPNPDFLLLRQTDIGAIELRAVDAKFAVDRLRRTQISAESIRELVELPGSLARQTIIDISGKDSLEQFKYLAGFFIGPTSLLNNFFRSRLISGDTPRIPASELLLIDVSSDLLFRQTEEYRLIELLKSVDQVPVAEPDSEIVLDMYYLRLACAARWFESRQRQPLLSLAAPEPIDVNTVHDAAQRRIQSGMSAYGLIEEWSFDAVRADEEQKRIKDAARLPVRMGEIRKLVARAGFGDDRKAVRQVRGALESIFLHQLIDETGEIPVQPREPIETIVERVARASQQLRTEMLEHANRILEQIESSRPAS